MYFLVLKYNKANLILALLGEGVVGFEITVEPEWRPQLEKNV